MELGFGNLRLFLFQTALASGAIPGFPPFVTAEARVIESRSLLPLFAINLGLAGTGDELPKLGVELADFSPGFEGGAEMDPGRVAKNVLFTETGLNDVIFLTVDPVRTWPFSSCSLEFSVFVASVSDPPLKLASVDKTAASV